MIAYRKSEIEDLALAIGRHWGGQTRDWRLVVEPPQHSALPTVALHVEITLGCYTRITVVPLCKPAGDSALPAAAPTPAPQDGKAVLTAVRRASVQSLLAQAGSGDIEALLGYLRCCGILVMD